MFDLIPFDRREAARAALRAVFGVTPLSALQPITSGASASIYRIEIAGRAYVLRMESLLRDDVRDPRRTYPCMQVAADAGIAPALRYADHTAGIAIMDFVQGHSLKDYPGGPMALARDLGRLAAGLQATPAFPPVADYPTVLDGMFGRLLDTGLFADGLLDAHRDGFERIRQAYAWESAALVSSHNDPHPGNILFDGERLWLIDWETAYLNDPLIDVAIMTLYLAAASELEDALLRSWLGRPADRFLRARLILMRQLVRLFYALANGLYVATARRELRETDLSAPTPAEFRAAIEQGSLRANTLDAQRVGGKVAFRTFLEGLAKPAFEDALVIARQG